MIKVKLSHFPLIYKEKGKKDASNWQKMVREVHQASRKRKMSQKKMIL